MTRKEVEIEAAKDEVKEEVRGRLEDEAVSTAEELIDGGRGRRRAQRRATSLRERRVRRQARKMARRARRVMRSRAEERRRWRRQRMRRRD